MIKLNYLLARLSYDDRVALRATWAKIQTLPERRPEDRKPPEPSFCGRDSTR